MTKIFSDFRALMGDRKGVTALEYGLIAALVAVIIIPTVTLLGPQLRTTFQTIVTALTPAV